MNDTWFSNECAQDWDLGWGHARIGYNWKFLYEALIEIYK